jgi:hypothetical protein
MHFWPKQLDKEILEIFPSLKMQDLTKLIVIPTWQPTKCDLAGIGPDIDEEKTRCLENVRFRKSISSLSNVYDGDDQQI